MISVHLHPSSQLIESFISNTEHVCHEPPKHTDTGLTGSKPLQAEEEEEEFTAGQMDPPS